MVLNPSSQVSWTIRIPSSNSLLQVFKATVMQNHSSWNFIQNSSQNIIEHQLELFKIIMQNNCSKHHPNSFNPPWNSLPPGASGWMDTTAAKELLAILTNAELVSGDLFFVFTISISELHLYHCKYLILNNIICDYIYIYVHKHTHIMIFIYTYMHTHAHMWLYIYTWLNMRLIGLWLA